MINKPKVRIVTSQEKIPKVRKSEVVFSGSNLIDSDLLIDKIRKEIINRDNSEESLKPLKLLKSPKIVK